MAQPQCLENPSQARVWEYSPGLKIHTGLGEIHRSVMGGHGLDHTHNPDYQHPNFDSTDPCVWAYYSG